MIRIGSVIAAALLVSACNGSQPGDGLSCYPEPARALINTDRETSSPSRDTGGPITVYLDGSASMVGYIRGGTPQERPLADLVGMLPRVQGLDHSQVSVVRFNRSFTDLGPAEIDSMESEAGYLCPASKPDCDAQESHIDQVLARIAGGDPQNLSVIVSDLWLANSELRTSDGVALSGPLSQILGSGRSIAIFGFEAPYSGRVNDLPSGRRDVRAQRRHLFVLTAGPLSRVRAFDAALRRGDSASIARDLENGRARHSLFTLDPVSSAPAGADAFEVPAEGAVADRVRHGAGPRRIRALRTGSSGE